MSIETAVTTLMNSLVPNQQFYFNTTPDGYNPHAQPVFVIGQFTGGPAGMYVDGTLQSLAEGRLQLWVWGARYMDVAALARTIRKAVIGLNATQTDIFRAASLNVEPVDDYNDILKIHGKRLDLNVVYADQDAPLP